jgi:phage baseplate assembly protein W
VPDLAWDSTPFTLIQQGQGLGLEDSARQLAKALYRRLITYPGELPAHPEYGCRLRDYAGMPADAWVARLAALEAKQALEADPRVRSARVEAYHEGERLVVEALVEPVEGYDLIPVRVEVP